MNSHLTYALAQTRQTDLHHAAGHARLVAEFRGRTGRWDRLRRRLLSTGSRAGQLTVADTMAGPRGVASAAR